MKMFEMLIAILVALAFFGIAVKLALSI